MIRSGPKTRLLLAVLFVAGELASAWLPSPSSKISPLPPPSKLPMSLGKIPEKKSFSPWTDWTAEPSLHLPVPGNVLTWTTAAAIATVAMTTQEPAMAAVAGAPNAVGSALASYGHMLSVMGIVACVVYERATIKPYMSPDEEDKVAIADALLGLWGATLTYSGYIRVVQYEKGWEFYQHEPVFWVKMFFVGIFGAASFFNTTKIIQRSVAKRTGGTVPPMSEALAGRMNQLLNAEITALVAIPLTASLMARGVGYDIDLYWPLAAAPTALALFGLGFKYVKEALDFDDAAGVVEQSKG